MDREDGGKAVVAEGLWKRFGQTEALRGVSFEIERGRVLALLGPNGGGETTAVGVLCTLLKTDAGRALIDSIDGRPNRAGLGPGSECRL